MSRHLTRGSLRSGLTALPEPPRDGGVVHLLVSRGPDHERWCPDSLTLDPETGVERDAWARKRRPNPEAMVTVMRRDVAELIANGQSLELFGDNLLVDFDLSEAWLPLSLIHI